MVMDPNGPLIGYAWFEQLEAENASLKAEVERLEQESNYWRIEAETDNARWLRVFEDVERLRKAGDAMASSIQFNEEMEQDYNGPTIVRQCVKEWLAAKEGKPSV